jgi:hypothetical protein
MLYSEFGNLSAGCNSLGLHYNPFNTTHGDPKCGEHHLGDLGNVPSDGSGNVNFTLTSYELSLNGKFSIVGCVIIVLQAFPSDVMSQTCRCPAHSVFSWPIFIISLLFLTYTIRQRMI